jgi:hypothetical protein
MFANSMYVKSIHIKGDWCLDHSMKRVLAEARSNEFPRHSRGNGRDCGLAIYHEDR